jgi:hypothetical protein
MIMFASQPVADEDIERDDQKRSDSDRKIKNVEHANSPSASGGDSYCQRAGEFQRAATSTMTWINGLADLRQFAHFGLPERFRAHAFRGNGI